MEVGSGDFRGSLSCTSFPSIVRKHSRTFLNSPQILHCLPTVLDTPGNNHIDTVLHLLYIGTASLSKTSTGALCVCLCFAMRGNVIIRTMHTYCSINGRTRTWLYLDITIDSGQKEFNKQAY